MNSLALTFNKLALTLTKNDIYQWLIKEVVVPAGLLFPFNINNLAIRTLKKRPLISLNNKNWRTKLFAALGVHPIMFVLQSLAVAAFMLSLFAAVIIAAALMGVL